MNNQISKRSFIAILGALSLAGCTVTVPVDGGPPIGGPPIGGGPIGGGPGGGVIQPQPTGPSIFLQSNVNQYSGRSPSGQKIRASASRSGTTIVLNSKTGRNFTENYRYIQGNTYRSPSGYSVRVTGTKSFVWSGPFGTLTMND